MLLISVDGLNLDGDQGPGPQPGAHLLPLIDEGATTLNAPGTDTSIQVSPPNHTGMVTGRRDLPASRVWSRDVTWNDDRLTPRTVQKAAGHPVSSVFRVVQGGRVHPPAS
ncbi:MAG: hypothetical protein R2734_08820 [Nocardioides sp.]